MLYSANVPFWGPVDSSRIQTWMKPVISLEVVKGLILLVGAGTAYKGPFLKTREIFAPLDPALSILKKGVLRVGFQQNLGGFYCPALKTESQKKEPPNSNSSTWAGIYTAVEREAT